METGVILTVRGQCRNTAPIYPISVQLMKRCSSTYEGSFNPWHWGRLPPPLHPSPGLRPRGQELLEEPFQRPQIFPASRNPSYKIPGSLRTNLPPRHVTATHNNFYEFLPGRGGPMWRYLETFEIEPWKLEIKGAVTPAPLTSTTCLRFPMKNGFITFSVSNAGL